MELQGVAQDLYVRMKRDQSAETITKIDQALTNAASGCPAADGVNATRPSSDG